MNLWMILNVIVAIVIYKLIIAMLTKCLCLILRALLAKVPDDMKDDILYEISRVNERAGRELIDLS